MKSPLLHLPTRDQNRFPRVTPIASYQSIDFRCWFCRRLNKLEHWADLQPIFLSFFFRQHRQELGFGQVSGCNSVRN